VVTFPKKSAQKKAPLIAGLSLYFAVPVDGVFVEEPDPLPVVPLFTAPFELVLLAPVELPAVP
jgi:hypothetical protein